jgi:hypothetical protein
VRRIGHALLLQNKPIKAGGGVVIATVHPIITDGLESLEPRLIAETIFIDEPRQAAEWRQKILSTTSSTSMKFLQRGSLNHLASHQNY